MNDRTTDDIKTGNEGFHLLASPLILEFEPKSMVSLAKSLPEYVHCSCGVKGISHHEAKLGI
jgi:hypothetical protein